MSWRKISLARIRVAQPCTQNWESMSGDDRRRFCDHCQFHVHNLSALTESEIKQLVARTEGRLCGRFQVDAFGRIVTQRERGWRGWVRQRVNACKLIVSSLGASLAGQAFTEPSATAPAAQTSPAEEKTSKPAPALSQPVAQPVNLQIQPPEEREVLTFSTMGRIICDPHPRVLKKKYKK